LSHANEKIRKGDLPFVNQENTAGRSAAG